MTRFLWTLAFLASAAAGSVLTLEKIWTSPPPEEGYVGKRVQVDAKVGTIKCDEGSPCALRAYQWVDDLKIIFFMRIDEGHRWAAGRKRPGDPIFMECTYIGPFDYGECVF